jgi:hypothetical protein
MVKYDVSSLRGGNMMGNKKREVSDERSKN